jgi:hypothetical protein
MLTELRPWQEVVAALAVGVLLGAGGIATGAVGGDSRSAPRLAEHGPKGDPVIYSAETDDGPGLPEDAAIRQVLEGMVGTPVRSATLVEPPGDSDAGPRWVAVELDGGSAAGPRAFWLGSLVEGAVADLMRTSEKTTSEVVGGAVVTGDVIDGAATQRSLGIGAVGGGQIFDSPDDETVRTHVAEIGKRFGIEVASLSLLHPLSTAIEVTFVVPDGVEIDWTLDDLLDALSASHTALEGMFVQLVSPTGAVMLTCSTADRVGAGQLKFAPGQDERFGAVHGGLARGLDGTSR